MIRIDVFAEKKVRNRQEWRPIPTATAEGIKISSDGPLIPKVAKALIDKGHPPEAMCEVWRGDTICFHAMTIGKWASGKALNGPQPEHLKRKRK